MVEIWVMVFVAFLKVSGGRSGCKRVNVFDGINSAMHGNEINTTRVMVID